MADPPITAEQFELEYAQRSGWTVEELREHRTVVRCQCGEDGCEGWAMVSHEAAETDYAPGGIYAWMAE